MPDYTPRMGLRKPLGHENVKREDFDYNWDLLDEPDAASLQGQDVAETAPNDKQVLTWNDGDGQWEPQDRDAASLQGRDVEDQDPNGGDALIWNGDTNQWEPTAPDYFDGAYGSLSGVPSEFAPSSHAGEHEDGGGDEINLDGLDGTPTELGVLADLFGDHVDDQTPHREAVSLVRSNKDANGIFTLLTWSRANATTVATSVLSGGTSPYYTLRTVVYYDTDGVTELETIVYDLDYDLEGVLISEVIQT